MLEMDKRRQLLYTFSTVQISSMFDVEDDNGETGRVQNIASDRPLSVFSPFSVLRIMWNQKHMTHSKLRKTSSVASFETFTCI